jgi:quercetin dioxygenase-like cupin family protein
MSEPNPSDGEWSPKPPRSRAMASGHLHRREADRRAARLAGRSRRGWQREPLAPELERFAAQLVRSPELWEPFVQHDDSSRVYHQIWDEEDVNAWLICWSEDQDTGYHDHDDSAAAIEVISGQVREDRLCLSDPAYTWVISAGERFSLPATAIHRVLHAGSRPAITIHAYSPRCDAPAPTRSRPTGCSSGPLSRTRPSSRPNRP